MTSMLTDYREALQRLRADRPTQVPRGTRITNDSVALEAGRKKGSIKRSRPVFAELLEEIAAAAADQARREGTADGRIDMLKSEVARYRALWEEALAREISLVKELWGLERERRSSTSESSKGKLLTLRRGSGRRGR